MSDHLTAKTITPTANIDPGSYLFHLCLPQNDVVPPCLVDVALVGLQQLLVDRLDNVVQVVSHIAQGGVNGAQNFPKNMKTSFNIVDFYQLVNLNPSSRPLIEKLNTKITGLPQF